MEALALSSKAYLRIQRDYSSSMTGIHNPIMTIFRAYVVYNWVLIGRVLDFKAINPYTLNSYGFGEAFG